jgi:hypothetical protein
VESLQQGRRFRGRQPRTPPSSTCRQRQRRRQAVHIRHGILAVILLPHMLVIAVLFVVKVVTALFGSGPVDVSR